MSLVLRIDIIVIITSIVIIIIIIMIAGAEALDDPVDRGPAESLPCGRLALSCGMSYYNIMYYTMHYTLYTIHYTLYTIHYTL